MCVAVCVAVCIAACAATCVAECVAVCEALISEPQGAISEEISRLNAYKKWNPIFLRMLRKTSSSQLIAVYLKCRLRHLSCNRLAHTAAHTTTHTVTHTVTHAATPTATHNATHTAQQTHLSCYRLAIPEKQGGGVLSIAHKTLHVNSDDAYHVHIKYLKRDL